ncbi:MAG: hypothetical protein MJY56_05675 [Bacteroidales bacterium]|nr:hypothetical protein [Bacteroidales bacterium]
MKKTFLILAVATMFVSCGKTPAGPTPGPTPTPTPKTSTYGPELYWADDYDGPLGLQLGTSASGEPRMMLAGVQLYTTGVNAFNIFTQALGNGGHHNLALIDQTVEVLKQEKVPYIRFSCSPFYDYQMNQYTDDKEAYFACLDHLATLCDEAHVLIMPSVFWHINCLPTYFHESLQDAWGKTTSQSYQFMLQYTKEVVDCLKGHKCLAAWEWGNEFNLGADIGLAGYEPMSAKCVELSLKGFAETCLANDPEQRLVMSGHAAMRPAQYHLYTQQNWTVDSFKEYKIMTDMMTPEPMKGMSEHIYEDTRQFSDLGAMNLTNQLIQSKKCAAELGKVYYVGEFTGPHSSAKDWEAAMEKHYAAHFAQRIQLSLVWNYALKGEIEWSYRADTEWGDATFRLMRQYNKKFERIKQD